MSIGRALCVSYDVSNPVCFDLCTVLLVCTKHCVFSANVRRDTKHLIRHSVPYTESRFIGSSECYYDVIVYQYLVARFLPSLLVVISQLS